MLRVTILHVAEGNFKEFYSAEVPEEDGLYQRKLRYCTYAGFGPEELDGVEVMVRVQVEDGEDVGQYTVEWCRFDDDWEDWDSVHDVEKVREGN